MSSVYDPIHALLHSIFRGSAVSPSVTMDHQPIQTSTIEYDELAVMDVSDGGPDVDIGIPTSHRLAERTPARKTRSLSDGGQNPQRFHPLHLVDARRTSKDDSNITIPMRDAMPGSGSNSYFNSNPAMATPSTPHRSVFPLDLSLQMPPEQASTPPSQQPAALYPKPAPLSPKLDHSQTYSSPTNILPRRSRGLDFSRAATSLHHTTLANQASPDSSPTIGGRGMNIPGRRPGDFGAPEQSSNSLWSVMGNHDRHHIATSLGSAANLVLDSSSSSDEDDIMEEDTDEMYCTTPHVARANPSIVPQGSGFPPGGGSPAANSLLSFQQRQRPRKQLKKKPRGLFGLGFPSTPAGSSMLSKSPPTNMSPYGNIAKEIVTPHARRESISWAANQLHISGSESDGSPKPGVDVDGVLGPGTDSQNRVVRRTVTRRSNLLPKSRNFSRVKMALAEEGTPIESEFRREAEVVRQVRDVDPEPPRPVPSTPLQETLDDLSEDAMMVDNGLSSSFKQQAQKNSKGRMFWETFSETSSGGAHTTPPPPSVAHRGSSSGMDEMAMDSPSVTAGPTGMNGFIFPITTTSSSETHTPQPGGPGGSGSSLPVSSEHAPPSAAEIARRFNMGKRRRDDDLDFVPDGNFKRRAVSPGMSVHGSPVMQSPLQHAPWGPRPGSNGDRGGSGGSGNGTPSESGGGGDKRPSTMTHKGRVGFQGMNDTNDGITRLSIE